MKKLICCIVCGVFLAALSGCAAQPKHPAMYLQRAALTEQEKSIATLLDTDDGQPIYDFVLDNTVQSVAVNVYRLTDGAWEPIVDGGQVFSDAKGRLALGFDNIAEGVRIALQSDGSNGATSHRTVSEEDFSGMSRATAFLDDTTEIIYEQEMPLVVQISTTKNGIRSFDVDTFFTPEQYESYGYEHVYAITLQFSQKPVGE